MILNRGQVFNIFPNKYIQQIFSQSFGNRRFIYNQLVNISNSPIYKFIENDKNYSLKSKKGLQKIVKELKTIYPFLEKSHSQSNQEAAHRVADNWDLVFKNAKGRPKYKKKNNNETFYIPNQNNIEIINNKLYIKPLKSLFKKKFGYMPKDGEILIDMKEKSIVKGAITGVTIKKVNNIYKASINFEYDNGIEKNDYRNIKILQKIGMDVGFKNKIIDNEGIKSSNKFRKHQDKAEKTKQKLQRKQSKSMERKKDEIIKKREQKTINKKEFNRIEKIRKKDKYANKIIEDKLSYTVINGQNSFSSAEWIQISKAGKKHQKLINILSRKIANITRNDNHHISKYYASNFDVVFMESLNFSAMQKIWGKSIGRLALSELVRMIKYKVESQGGIFIQIDKWFPSTKLCSDCGFKHSLSLDVREWTCPSCNSFHDRDINAAKNIFAEGLRILYSIYYEKLLSSITYWNRTSPSNSFEKQNLLLHYA